MKFCQNCGSKLEEGAKFCGRCGQPVDNNRSKQTAIEPSMVSNKKSNSKYKWIGFGVIGLIILGLVYFLFIGNSPLKGHWIKEGSYEDIGVQIDGKNNFEFLVEDSSSKQVKLTGQLKQEKDYYRSKTDSIAIEFRAPIEEALNEIGLYDTPPSSIRSKNDLEKLLQSPEAINQFGEFTEQAKFLWSSLKDQVYVNNGMISLTVDKKLFSKLMTDIEQAGSNAPFSLDDLDELKELSDSNIFMLFYLNPEFPDELLVEYYEDPSDENSQPEDSIYLQKVNNPF